MFLAMVMVSSTSLVRNFLMMMQSWQISTQKQMRTHMRIKLITTKQKTSILKLLNVATLLTTKYGLIQINLMQTTRTTSNLLVSLMITMKLNWKLSNQISRLTMVRLVLMLLTSLTSQSLTVWLLLTLKLASLSHLVMQKTLKLSILLSSNLDVTTSLSSQLRLLTVLTMVLKLKIQQLKSLTTTTQLLRKLKHLTNQLKNVLTTFQLLSS